MECRCSHPLAAASSLATELRLYALSLVVAGISGALTCLFALAGAFTGAVAGAVAGGISNSSVLRGAIFGALAGSIISIQVLEAARTCWCSEQVDSQNALPMAEFIMDMVHARLAQRQFPSGLTANGWQVDFTGLNNDDPDDVVEEISTKGLTLESLKRLPCHAVEAGNNRSERVCCTICFEDIVVGETVRSLPLCKHKFHLSCVDKWLLVHGSCPICRRKL